MLQFAAVLTTTHVAFTHWSSASRNSRVLDVTSCDTYLDGRNEEQLRLKTGFDLSLNQSWWRHLSLPMFSIHSCQLPIPLIIYYEEHSFHNLVKLLGPLADLSLPVREGMAMCLRVGTYLDILSALLSLEVDF